VRLTLASLLQKLDLPGRAALAALLLSRAEDATDHNLPLMLWYGIEPLVGAPAGTFEKLVAQARIPRVQRFGARRLADDIDSAPARLDALLAAAVEVPIEGRRAMMDGIADGLTGRRKAPKPPTWDSLQSKLASGADQALRNRLRDLSALFGDGRALDEIRATALDASNTIDVRRAALQVLVESRAPGLLDVCTKLFHERDLSGTAATGLALTDDPAIADLLLAEWPRLNSDERAPVVSALISRPAWAAKALDALADGRLLKGNINAFSARQIRSYHDPVLTARLDKLWGKVRDAKEGERAAVLAKWKPKFPPEILSQADKAKGRATFQTVCAVCHTLNGEGAAIGPDLTGAARDNLDYLLDNILFPSAVVADQYKQVTLTLKDGRSLAGMIRTRSPIMIRLQTVTDIVSLPVSEVAQEEASSLSMMPEGLLESLDESSARNLIAYLMTK
jgi:putative heme-binding domain-containing protein